MRRSIQIKICGLTREADIDLALSLGANYCGFIVYPHSPRAVSYERAVELAARVPTGKRVIVDVEPSIDDLKRWSTVGFDYFQIHAKSPIAHGTLASWAGFIGKERLWLAPRIAPGQAFPEGILQFADTVLFDTFSKDQFGGTGEVGDWVAFSKLRKRYPKTNWVLAGGLGLNNLTEAVAKTGARRVDINSRVEIEPGIKDATELREIFRKLQAESDPGPDRNPKP